MYKEPIIQLLEIALNTRNSEEVGELLGELSIDVEKANGEFCDKLELGNWFYESMILHDVNIREELERIGLEKILLEDGDRAENKDLLESWA